MKLRKISGIFMAAVLLSTSFTWTSYASTTVQNSTKRYIVKFKTKNTDGNKFISKYNGKVRKQFRHVDGAVADITPQNLTKLQKDPNVAYVEEDNVVKATAIQMNWGISDIKAPVSWQSGLTGKGIKIAVIDTGIAAHSDLSIAGGTNVISGSSTAAYADDNGHGTHVAGIIGGKGLNGGVKGVAPDASIYAVKALDAKGSGYTSDIIAGIDWAIENKIDIISMSFGCDQADISLQNAVDTAYKNGILVVAAAGNDGNAYGTGTNVQYPAKYSSVIAVGAVDSTNKRAAFSSTGNEVEVSAPGVNIVSTYLNGLYAQMSGTSMAAPFVAGDLALLKQKYPSYTNVQLRQLLDNNVIDLGATGKDPLYGFGLVQAPVNTTSVNNLTTPAPKVNIPTPYANIPAGTYKTPLFIKLYDKYSKPLWAFYTLDGSTPTTKSLPYKGYINITSSCTLKVIVVDSYGNTSGILSNQYKIIIPSAKSKVNVSARRIY